MESCLKYIDIFSVIMKIAFIANLFYSLVLQLKGMCWGAVRCWYKAGCDFVQSVRMTVTSMVLLKQWEQITIKQLQVNNKTGPKINQQVGAWLIKTLTLSSLEKR